MNAIATGSLIGLLLAGSAAAQHQFGPLGNQIMDGSQNMVTINLGFNFTMPGGTVVTALDVDEHGRMVEVGSDPSDSSESTSEMVNNPGASINVMWDFNSYTASPNAGVYFFTDNSGFATITWTNVQFIAPPCTYQCQLFGDGRIVMVYDSNCPADDGIIGVCPGNGAILPTQSNLDDAINVAPIVSTDVTVFEDFGFNAGVDAFDFPSSALEFVPNGAGGVSGWTVNGNAGVVDPILPFSQNEEIGGGCIPAVFNPVTLFWTPDGVGGYDVTNAPLAFDTNIGPDAGLTNDDQVLGGFDLGFAFTWPDGTVDQFAKVDSNGRIAPDSSSMTADFSPSLFDMHNDGHAIIAALWTDMNISLAGSGKIHFNTVPGTSATFTWDNTYQFGGSAPLTFQVTLYSTGLIQINLADLVNYNQVSGADDTIIGTSTGVGPDPGEIDISALGTANTGATTYEFWDSSGTSPVEPFDLVSDLTASYGSLAALTTPQTGTNWDLEIQGAPASSLIGFYIIGLGVQNLDVTALGSPCVLVPTADLIEFVLPTGPGVLPGYSLAIPNNPALTGFELNVQGAHDAAPSPPFTSFAGLPLQIAFTNAIRGTVGTL